MTRKYYLYWLSVVGGLPSLVLAWRGDYFLFTDPRALIFWLFVFLYPYASLKLDGVWNKAVESIKNPTLRDWLIYPGRDGINTGFVIKLILAIPVGLIVLLVGIRNRLKPKDRERD